MKASIHFELETPEDFVAFANVFGVIVTPMPTRSSNVIHAAAPEPDKQIAKPVVDKAAKATEAAAAKKAQAEADAKSEAEAKAAAAAEVDDADGQVETVDKGLVAKELRAFIAKRGAETGPKEALAVLKEFGASKFDELKAEDYSKFLTKLGKAA